MQLFRFARLTIWLATTAVLGVTSAQNVPLDALMRGGRIHYTGGRFDRAREQFQKALDQYGSSVDRSQRSTIHLWLGLTEAQLRNFLISADHLAIAFDADTATIAEAHRDETMLYWAGTALLAATREKYAAGENETALRYALAALHLDPEKPQIYALVANIYSALGRYDEMRETAERLLRLNTGSPEAYGLLGLFFLQRPDSLWPTRVARLARFDSCAYYYDRALILYRQRLAAAHEELRQALKSSDTAAVQAIARQLIEKSRLSNNAELRRYIERDLKKTSPQELQIVSAVASRLFFAANNMNSAAARAGTAMLRASTDTRGDTAERFRSRAEELFALAVEYDSADFNSLFNLGIALYQGQKDSTAATVFQRVIDGAVVPLTALPIPWQEKLLPLVTAENAPQGFTEIPEPLASSIDSVIALLGAKGRGYFWYYFPDARTWQPYRVGTLSDAAGMMLSSEMPSQLENAYLLLGVSLTGFGLAQNEARRPDVARDAFERAIGHLQTVARINPANAEAYQNLVHCYRETGQPSKAEDAYKLYKKYSQ